MDPGFRLSVHTSWKFRILYRGSIGHFTQSIGLFAGHIGHFAKFIGIRAQFKGLDGARGARFLRDRHGRGCGLMHSCRHGASRGTSQMPARGYRTNQGEYRTLGRSYRTLHAKYRTFRREYRTFRRTYRHSGTTRISQAVCIYTLIRVWAKAQRPLFAERGRCMSSNYSFTYDPRTGAGR